MNERHELEPLVHDWLHQTLDEIPDPSHRYGRVAAEVCRTGQLRGWLPRLDPGRSSMFSALKYVVAGVIVALLGGLLVAGIVSAPQGDETVPAAVTESPSPMTSVELLSGMVTEEVEPGVLRVVNDGVRDLSSANNRDIVAGHDGGIWLLRPQRFVRLGSDEWHAWPTKKPEVTDFEVAPDGTVWAMLDGERLYSVGRGNDDWTPTTRDAPYNGPIEVTSDGTVWALWGDDPEDPESLVFGYLGADGWQALGEWPDWHPARGWCLKIGPCPFLVSDRGEVWAIGFPRDVQHFVDGAWRVYDEPADLLGSIQRVAVGTDGTLWGFTRKGFFRFDGTEWTTFDRREGFPTDGRGVFHVAPDGSLWVVAPPGECGPRDQCGCHHGVARFDGMSWGRYLPDLCVKASDITADGLVWLLAGEEMLTTYDGDQQAWFITDDTTWDLYVITPEAVATSE